MDAGTTTLAGIAIPSTNPVFLTVVGIHIALGLVCVVTGAVAALSQKRAGRHPRNGTIYFWCLGGVFLTATGLAAVRWAQTTICSFWAPCHLRQPLWAARPEGHARASGPGCTSPAWDRPMSCC